MLSIGALSRAAGVPVETLRTWERRYGFPAPIERVQSGHRRYPLGAVERLRLAVSALELGHKPSVVLRATPETLRQLLALREGQTATAVAPRKPKKPPSGSFVERCLAHIVRLDGEPLVRELEQAWNDVGALEFLQDCMGPLLAALGDAWGRGELEIGHEHFTSEYVHEFLSAHWRQMSERARGPHIVCATVRGELHVLGLHMAATALALAGARVVFLGANTPPDEVLLAVSSQKASAVALSAARGVNRKSLERDVKALVSELPKGFPITAGGAGFDPPPAGVTLRHDFRTLSEWARTLSAR